MAPRPLDKKSSSSTTDPWKYPTNRDSLIKSGELWLEGKREDDGAEGLWRIHDELYDLSRWINNHPGGAVWIKMTKGTDITEAFESYHVFETAERLLPMFHVRSAKTSRNSPYTFKPTGFYRTLKGRVRETLKEVEHNGLESSTGPTKQAKMIADLLVSAVFVTAVMAASLGSYTTAALTGVLLAFTTISAHNFFHQRDNFRMFYFDLSLLSSRDWRISHGLSHHLYTNSMQDLEMSMSEPWLQYLPKEKTWLERYGSWLYSPIVYTSIFHAQLVLRLVVAASGRFSVLRWSDLIPLSLPISMCLHGGLGITDTLLMWTWIILVSSFTFGLVGVNAGHHHPDVYHAGDAVREDRDWGLHQLDAVLDRKEVCTNLLLALTNFGHHSLHHLFPTIDHSRLGQLYPLLKQTCQEYGIDYQVNCTSSVLACIQGQFLQLARTKPNLTTRGAGKKKTL